MFPYLFSVGSEANVKQCVLFVLGRPAVYLLFISIIRNETCTFRISYNIFTNRVLAKVNIFSTNRKMFHFLPMNNGFSGIRKVPFIRFRLIP